MPRAVDVLEIAHHDRVTGGSLVHDGASPGASRAQWPTLVRAVVGDGIEGAVDVVDPHAVPADGHQLVATRWDLVYCCDDMLAALGEAGLGPPGGCPLLFRRQFRAPGPGPRGPAPCPGGG